MAKLTGNVVLLALVLTGLCGGLASAQVFGTFAWRMAPYCNVVTLTITQFPGGYAVDGHDNQCASGPLASATGQVLINPDGTVGVNFTIVTSPAAKGVHVAAIISPANGSGTWTDSIGNSGGFLLAAPGTGLPRPLPASGLGTSVVTTAEIAPGAVGVADINVAEVQARVTGVCPVGEYLRGVNPDGSVVCASLAAVATGGPIRRNQFNLTTVPTTSTNLATSVALSTLTFTPAVSGTALLFGRGTCNTFASTGQVVIGSYFPGETTDNANPDRAFILVNLGGMNQQIPFTAERAVSVIAGTSYTFTLRANQSASASVAQACSGSYSVSLHSGVLP